MGGGSKQTQVSEVKLPAWVEQASQENYNFAKDVANRPYQPYTGNTVADFSADQYAGFDYARNNVGAYQGVYDNAIGMAGKAGASRTPGIAGGYGYQDVYAPMTGANYSAQNVNAERTSGAYNPYNVNANMTTAGYQADRVAPSMATANYQAERVNPNMTTSDYNSQYVEGKNLDRNYRGFITGQVTPQTYNYNYSPETVQAQSFKSANVADYMNPYLDQVESYALQNLQSGTQMGLNTIGDQAARAGAFGGSRQGVQEGALMGDAAKRAGELSANVRAQGFDRAMQQITADQNRNLQGQMANQSAGLQNASYGLQAGLANQNAAMRAQEINRQTDLDLAGLAQRTDLANQATSMQAALANQQAGMDLNRLNQASQFANQQANLQAALANQSAGLDINRLDQAAQFANQRAGLEAGIANQNARLEINRLDQASQLANQRAALEAALGNQSNATALNRLDLDSQLANQRAGLEAAMANQNAGMQLNELDQASQFANQKALMEAQIANQQAGLTNNQLDFNVQSANQSAAAGDLARQLQSALGMAGLADQGNANINNDLGRLLSIGGMQQDQSQKYLNDQLARFIEQRDYPKEQLNILLSSLGMSPYGKTQTTTQNNPTNWGGVVSGVGSGLLGLAMMSDETMKTDIQKVGKDKETGLDVYSYRYKGDPKSYPKVVGLMADDIEEKMPNTVEKVGGKKAVKFNPSVPKNRIAKAKG